MSKQIIAMISAKLSDKKLISRLLTDSFTDNKSVNYIVKQDESKKKRLSALIDYSFEMCMLFGEVFMSDDKTSCALILYPDKKEFNLRSIWLDVKLVFNSIGIANATKAMSRESKIKSLQKKQLSAYLWFIGVDPKYANQGRGSKLLQELIMYTQKQNRTILLETSTLKNLPWYQKFGFRIYNELDLGYKLYFLEKAI